MRALLAACRGLAVDYNILLVALNVFEDRKYYIYIHAPYTHTVVFWQISNISNDFVVIFIIYIF